MNNWFQGQLDYIFFFYGLAFIGLGVVSYILSKEVNQRLPWVWLALFGFTHGLSEWLDLVALAWPDGVWFAACRWAVMTASFLFLVEFGRLGLIRSQGRGPGRWLLVILALGACLGALSDWSGLNATTRYAIGLVGGLWTAGALFAEGRQVDSQSRPWLLAGGGSLLLYGLAAGLIVPRAVFLPAAAVNYETFSTLTGLPIQLVRGVLALWTTVMIVGYFETSQPASHERSYRSRIHYIYGVATSLVLILVAGWFFTQFMSNMAREQVRKDYVSKGKLIIQRLTFELEEAEAAVKAMSGSPWINPALLSRSPQTTAQANSVLDRYQMRFEASPAFILDQTGTCITSSNRDAPDSFVGHNYTFRPYFQQAIAGQPGRYFALGVVSKKRGFFASYPVRDPGGRIVGIAAIKTTLDRFQQELRESDPAFLIDPDGVIFLGSRPSLDYHSLWPVNLADRAGLKAQYGTANFESVFPQLLKDGAEVKIDGKNYLFHRQAINAPAAPGWSLVSLAPVNLVVFYRMLGIAAAFFVVVLTLVSFGIILSIREGANHILASESRFRAMFVAAPEAVFVYDPETRKIIDANPFMTQWLGYESEELVGLEIDKVTAPGSLEPGETCAREGSEGTPGPHYRKKDGSLVDVECTVANILHGDHIRELVFVRDITARKRAEQALLESEAQYRLLAENVIDVIWTMDLNWKFTYASPSCESLSGYSDKELVGMTLDQLLTPESMDLCNKTLAEVLSPRSLVRQEYPNFMFPQLELRFKDGSKSMYIEVKGSFLKDSQGQPRGMVGVTRDVTERKQLEEQYLQAQKMEAVGTLAGGIAHDFNNILTAILGNIGIAVLDDKIGPQVQDRLAQAKAACLRAKALSQQLLTFAKGGAPVKKLFSVAELLTQSIPFTCAGSPVRCRTAFPENLWSIEADPGQIGQVFQNLTINAIQAMPTGGTIKVWAENLTLGTDSNLPLSAGKYIKISVRDQGMGIPVEHIPRIFDPYFTTKQNGSGLGLASTYAIIKQHHGRITVESKPGGGTTFNIYLPAVEQQVIPQPEEDGELVVGKGKILVMDDEEMVREVLGGMLTKLGYGAAFARDGGEAIEMFVQAQGVGQAFAAVIFDLTVPGGMGGKETMARLLEIDPRARAIVSSGYSDDRVMAEFAKYGFKGVIVKPYGLSELSRVLNKVLSI